MKIYSTLSDVLVTNVGAPQDRVSFPILFTLYTNDCMNRHINNYIIKFSDDTTILSLLTNTSDVGMYKSEIEGVVQWFEEHNLRLNVKITKEMIFDPRLVGDHSPILINEEEVEQVTSYKYLDIYFDFQLQWSHHVNYVCTGASQRLHFLRRLRVYGVDKTIMLLFYRSAIESIISYGLTIWFGDLTVKLRSQLQNVVEELEK